MAIANGADIEGILLAAAAVVEDVTGIVAVYDRAGEIPADDDALPAVLQHVAAPDLEPAGIEYLTGQRVIWHRWYLDVLVDRGGDLYAEQVAAFPFVERIISAFQANIHLGQPAIVARCLPQSYQLVVLTAGEQSFLAVRFLMECRTKTGTSYSDPG